MMLCWCRLEAALDEAMPRATRGLNRKPDATFADRYSVFRTRVEEVSRGRPELENALVDLSGRIDQVRRQRNLVVHGLTGISADPRRGEPHLICEERDRRRIRRVQVHQSELTRLLCNLDRCRLDLENIGHAARTAADRREAGVVDFR
ncbi:hypothetical protein ACM61V_16595 [Sphingomonas sp. TX0543]|uniref:hypothetical protein n=1 Tax=Sphingomonas sp. TX0543 TaxID=3399682 RepID=UPI003AFB3534